MKTVSFIGSGRITRIFIEGLTRKNSLPDQVRIFDTNPESAANIKSAFPSVIVSESAEQAAESSSLVIIAVHPPAFTETASKISRVLSGEETILSLVPKFTIDKIAEAFPKNRNTARMNPNAPSIINEGFNPVSYSYGFNKEDKAILIKFLSVLGETPEVPDGQIEAFAVITAMGYTYLDYQFNEIFTAAKEFGIDPNTAAKAVIKLAEGCAKTVMNNQEAQYNSMDLVPVRPMADIEEAMKTAYRSKLSERYKMLTN